MLYNLQCFQSQIMTHFTEYLPRVSRFISSFFYKYLENRWEFRNFNECEVQSMPNFLSDALFECQF